MSRQTSAYIYAALAIAAWSTVASAFKIALAHLDVLQLLFYANLTAAIMLGAILLLQRKGAQLRSMNRKELLTSLGLGLLNPLIYYLVLFRAYDELPAQIVQPINYTWALVLMALSVPILKQSLRHRDIIAALIAYIGVAIICTRGEITSLHIESTTGLAMAFLSTLLWALYWIYSSKSSAEPICALFVGFLFGLPFAFIICLTFSTPFVESTTGLYAAIYTGAFEMGLSFCFWLVALKRTSDSAKIGLLIFLAPFVSLQLLQITVGEKIHPATYLGLAFIITGLILQKIGFRIGKKYLL